MKHSILMAFIAALCACNEENTVAMVHATSSDSQPVTLVLSQRNTENSLYDATMLAWQKASFQAKRETCSEVVLALFEEGNLPLDELNEVQLKLLSETLVQQLNKRFEMAGTAQQNKKAFENERVSNAIIDAIEEKNWLVKS